jgi:hypothetical protein
MGCSDEKKAFLCLAVLFFTAYSAFAEKGLRFDLGVDGFLTVINSADISHDDGVSPESDDIAEETSFMDISDLSPLWPFIEADLYYQTSGEKYRFGFGAKIYSLIFASIAIPSVYAEMNLERFAATAQFGIIPMVLSLYVPLMPLPVADISVSAWFKATEKFKIGFTAMLISLIPYGLYNYYDTYNFLPVYAVSLRWTLAGA